MAFVSITQPFTPQPSCCSQDLLTGRFFGVQEQTEARSGGEMILMAVIELLP